MQGKHYYLDVPIGHVLVDAIDEELAALLCHDPVLSALGCRLAVAGTLAFYCDAAGRQSRPPYRESTSVAGFRAQQTGKNLQRNLLRNPKLPMAVAPSEKALSILSIRGLTLPGRVRRQGTTTRRWRGRSMETPLFLLLPSGGSQGVLLGARHPARASQQGVM